MEVGESGTPGQKMSQLVRKQEDVTVTVLQPSTMAGNVSVKTSKQWILSNVNIWKIVFIIY